MRIFVTGATGFIGERVASVALDRDIAVRALARSEWLGRPEVPLRDRVLGRLPHLVPSDAFDGCDAVVHCAVSTDADYQVARAVNVVGTLEVARAARDAGARAFVFMSSQSARPDTPSVYGRTKHEAETALLADPSLNAIVIRPGLVCGQGGLFKRLSIAVQRLPVTPLLAGDAPVQPVFVDDLVDAILRCATEPALYVGRTLAIGSARPITLREFVGVIVRHLGRPHLIVRVPVRPVELALGTAERLGLRLPITATNVVGAREARVMDTATAHEIVGMPDRSVEEIVALAMLPAEPAQLAEGTVPSRTLLIGAGRIGIVHAVTLSRLPGAVLAGTLDRRSQAVALLRSVGLKAPAFTDERGALRGRQYDAAVIATPPATHLALGRSWLERGVRVLIEKPAARTAADLAALGALGQSSGDRALVGYLMPRMPHLRPWLARLQAGQLGTVRSFTGITLVSLIDARSGPRWETAREISGGGVLTNSGTHVLSLIHAAFGQPRATRTEVARRFSADVEDCAIVEFDYGTFSGRQFASWCMPGFPRQENRLIVETDRGTLTLSATTALFEDANAQIVIEHQLDHEVGFNLAPDYAGAGIAAELRELGGYRFVGPLTEPMTLTRGLDIERLLFSLYDQASYVERFTVGGQFGNRLKHAVPRAPVDVCVDIRDARAEVISAARDVGAKTMLIRAAQLESMRDMDSRDLVVTVPDFLGYTRLITDRQRGELLRRLGGRGATSASWTGGAMTLRHRGLGFWPVAMALLSAELTHIPRGFAGTLLLHPYLADLAIALERTDILQGLLDLMRRKPNARIGLHSNLGREAANALLLLRRVPDVLSVLTSANGSELSSIRHWFDDDPRASRVELMAEVGPAPLALHQLAISSHDRWAPSGVRLVVNALAIADADDRVQQRWHQEWSAMFPGTEAPRIDWVT